MKNELLFTSNIHFKCIFKETQHLRVAKEIGELIDRNTKFNQTNVLHQPIKVKLIANDYLIQILQAVEFSIQYS